MSLRVIALTASLLFVGAATPAFAHRLDEYLQATFVSVGKDQVKLDVFLTPGTAVLALVLADIDTDQDGVISETEQRAYATRVLADLSLALDGHRLSPRLVAAKFPPLEEMKEGRGDIHLEISADLPGRGPNRTLQLTNAHHRRIAAYQINCLVPRDPHIRISTQRRDHDQSVWELDYTQTDARGT